MKPEYIKVMQRKIHSANVLMERQRGQGCSSFNIFVWYVCPQWKLSEKVDATIESRYEIAIIITGISMVERKADQYTFAYDKYIDEWFADPVNEGYLPPTPEEWKIREQVQ